MSSAFMIVRDICYNDDSIIDLSPRMWFSQSHTCLNRYAYKMCHEEMALGDKAFLKIGGWIYLTGSVVDKSELFTFLDYRVLIAFLENQCNIRDHKYRYQKVLDFSKNQRLHFYQYCVEGKIFDRPLAPPKPVQGRAFPIYRLNEHEVAEIETQENQQRSLGALCYEINPSMRRAIWDIYRKNNCGFFDDIDHVIPKSLGGRGDIEWNLIPVNRSINRNKGDRAGVEVIETANEDSLNNKFEPSPISSESFRLMNPLQQREAVRGIMAQVAQWPNELQLSFYQEHLRRYFPSAHKILTAYFSRNSGRPPQ